ncbi:MAG TPA: hypothetical protein VIK78_19640 [Ruminiclostridium sp.]
MNKSQFVKQATKDLATLKRKVEIEVDMYGRWKRRSNRKVYGAGDKQRGDTL